MADGWRREDDKSRQNKDKSDGGSGWDLFGAIAGGVLLAGAAGYAISKVVEKAQEEEKKEETVTRPNSFHFSSSNSMNFSRPEIQCFTDDTIIIGVDATERRAGGLMVLPDTKTIYFYSIDWSHVFRFPSEPDKFELTNVLLALEIFKKYLQKYRERWDSNFECSLNLKTDNSVGSIANSSHAYRGSGNMEFKKFYQDIDEKLKSHPFYGNWKQVPRQDMHIKMADRLSKVDHSCSKGLPDDLPDSFPEYVAVNISETDRAVLHTVAMQVPAQFKR